MLPADGGRICLGCGKLVSDFRNSSWKEIEKVHNSSPIPVCGIYSEKQINSWGHEPSKEISCPKLVAISAAMLALIQASPLNVKSQTNQPKEQTSTNQSNSKNNSLKTTPKQKIVCGTAIALQSDSTKLPLQGVEVFIFQDSLNLKTTTDSAGRFSIDITRSFNTLPEKLTVFFNHADLISKRVEIDKNNLNAIEVTFSIININAKTTRIKNEPTKFYVTIKKDEVHYPCKKWWQFWKKKN